ncbi:hypothetical protein ABMA28_013759 [Loxostege sticticalis]|uniref:Major facilitator superfamily (MFS) profile domain-containing protein n=1 Tax=Loxostege sticticalis TaxID=481309 RepID=A0ABD0TJF2_LOXSC
MLFKFKKYVVSDKTEKHSHTYAQWSIAFLGASVLVTVGFLIGWVSPTKKILMSDASPTGSPLTDTEMSAIASTMTLAAIAGVPACSYVGEAYGRKAAILVIIALQMICWIIKLLATKASVLIVARAIAGIGYGATYVVVPMYIREISQDSIKGLLGTLIMSAQHIGVLVMYAMGSYLNYHTTLWIVLCFAIATFLLILLIPESPAFLVKIGKFEVATETLAFLRRLHVNDVSIQNEINYMKDEDTRYKSSESISFKSIVKNKVWLRAIVINLAICCCVAFNGVFGIVTYAWSIMKEAGLSVSPELQSFVVPILLIFGTIVPFAFVERAGRKPLLAGAFVTTGVSMVCLASALLAQRCGVAVPGWVIVLSIAVAVTSYSAGILTMPTIILNDMLRFHVRSKIMSPITIASLGVVSIYVAIFDPISNAFGLYSVFFISAGANFLGAVIVLMWLPETRGRTVEEIEAMLLGKKGDHVTPSEDVANAK